MGCNIAKHLQKPQIWYSRLKKHQASVSASLGLVSTRWHMQSMQVSEILHLLGHSSDSAGSWDVFRGRWHNTAISGILLWRCVLSRASWGVLFHYFPSTFSISSTCKVGHLDLEFLLSHISSNFCDVFCWTLHFVALQCSLPYLN